MKMLTISTNESGLKDFKKGWMARYPDGKNPGWFKVVVNKEQYEAMEGSEHDPWIE